MHSTKLKLVFQLAATLFILASGLENIYKTVLLLLLWLATFYPLTKRELILWAVTSIFFPIMDILVIKQGTFFFTNPDVGLLPSWEIFMFGFYMVHTMRMLDGAPPKKDLLKTGVFAIALAIAFASIGNQTLLTYVTYAILLLGIFWYHEPMDLFYVAYFILCGILFESIGVYIGLWGYKGHFYFILPAWFIPLWGGIGLLLRRLILPFMK